MSEPTPVEIPKLLEKLSGCTVSMPPEDDVLDLVCSESALCESRGRTWLAPGRATVQLREVGTMILLAFLGIGTLVIVAWLWKTWIFPVLVLLAYCLVQVRSLRPHTDFPTNILLDKAGIQFAWRGRLAQVSEVIPWDSIALLSGQASRRGKGHDILVCIDLSSWTPASRWSIAADTCSLWCGFLPSSGTTGAKSKHWLHLCLPLEALTLQCDRQRLISALDRRARAAVKTAEFSNMRKTTSACPSFTEMWLDDINSFRRQRLQPLETGALLQDGRYRIKGAIASGGQAKIYRAIDNNDKSAVALKELVLPTHAGAEVRSKAFANVKDEAMLHAGLNHPGIVKLLDNFVEDHRAYLVLEYIEGRSLRAAVREDGPLAEAQVVRVCLQACNILSYLHGLSPPVVHRDLTPDNLMISADGTMRLLDFNVAQRQESNRTKTVVGKHNYMAPEQFRGKPSTQSDLYSLGCTLYYLLTGSDPEPLSACSPSARAQVSEALDRIINKLTQPDEQDRYQSAQQLASDIEPPPAPISQ